MQSSLKRHLRNTKSTSKRGGMRGKTVYRSFCDDLYRARYHIYICKGDRIRSTFKKKYNIDLEDKDASGSFYAVKSDGWAEELVIWLDKYDEIDLLHEVTHAVIYVLDKRGITINSENDEPMCYYTGWLFSKIKKLVH